MVGTEFNLRHRDGSVALTVRRGVVEVRPGRAPRAPARPGSPSASNWPTSRAAAQALTQAGRAEAAFAWTSGQLVYRDQPLSEVAADLTRRFGVPVRAADAGTAALRFSGVLVTRQRGRRAAPPGGLRAGQRRAHRRRHRPSPALIR